MRRIGVFCGSSMGNGAHFGAAADAVAVALVAHDLELVYGGAHVGLMGRIADEVLARGGRVIGVIPQSMVEAEVAHSGLSQLHIVATMAERKQQMADLSDGFIALPGGMGTLEEITEMLTLTQLHYQDKPCGFINVAGYYDHLFAFLEHAVDAGFLHPAHHRMICVAQSAEELLAQFRRFQSPSVRKWPDHS
ncbi:MAG: TIGR00730 family Rossman fold protein [Deltaproteobacteria bacterium]|nr:TIGR00730 family Rossman fold protein [Deltaproteobacteria bacterium]